MKVYSVFPVAMGFVCLAIALNGVSPLEPGKTVTRMNELFHGFGGGAFFTICYAVMELSTGRVRTVRAGHPFPLVLRADGRLEEIRSQGNAVGISPRLELVETEILMGRGDRSWRGEASFDDDITLVGVQRGTGTLDTP
jgi:serine phosphatase RsbU (regulator of sigma subunit)